MLRPPPPDLHGSPTGRIELRVVDKNGLSIGGERHFSCSLHAWGYRDAMVIRCAGGRPLVLTRDGNLHSTVTERELTTAFRSAFYASRTEQRDAIEAHCDGKLAADRAEPLRKTSVVAAPVAQNRPQTRPSPLDSPLDALQPLSDLGWPFDDLKGQARPTNPEDHAPPLRQHRRQRRTHARTDDDPR